MEFWCRVIAGYSFMKHAPIKRVKNITIPTYIMNGTDDNFIPHHMSQALFDNCGAKVKAHWTIEGGIHNDTNFRYRNADFKTNIEKFFADCDL